MSLGDVVAGGLVDFDDPLFDLADAGAVVACPAGDGAGVAVLKVAGDEDLNAVEVFHEAIGVGGDDLQVGVAWVLVGVFGGEAHESSPGSRCSSLAASRSNCSARLSHSRTAASLA